MKLVGRADELEKASSLVSQEEDARHVGAWPLAAHLGRSKLGGAIVTTAEITPLRCRRSNYFKWRGCLNFAEHDRA